MFSTRRQTSLCRNFKKNKLHSYCPFIWNLNKSHHHYKMVSSLLQKLKRPFFLYIISVVFIVLITHIYVARNMLSYFWTWNEGLTALFGWIACHGYKRNYICDIDLNAIIISWQNSEFIMSKVTQRVNRLCAWNLLLNCGRYDIHKDAKTSN